ncbi:MAG: basic secretory family protein [Actinomycetota bacterium]|nr:basic secretory family protein [Actinomycetota bacterium]
MITFATLLSGCAPRASVVRAPTSRSIGELLARHAQAVLHRSSGDFVADLDPAVVDADFNRRQGAEIAALSGVPLRLWNYSVDSVVADPNATAAASKRLGAPAIIAHVTLSYALSAVDPMPITHALYWTFDTRDGRTYLAGDGDLADLGGPSWQGIWDFGPVVVGRGGSGLVLAHPDQAAQVGAVTALIDESVRRVSAVWGTDWTQQVAVLVPGSPAEFAALTGPAAPAGPASASLADISAETVLEQPPGPQPAVPGVRVVLSPNALARLTPAGRSIVMTHEVTHVATAAVTNQFAPRWLIEGFADYVANLDSGQPVAAAAAELAGQVRRGILPGELPSDADFSATAAAGLAQTYEQAWLACRLIAARSGASGLARLYRLVNGAPDPAVVGVAAGLQQVLHEPPAAFVTQWRSYLRAELGRA